jgi:hypothetical protein
MHPDFWKSLRALTHLTPPAGQPAFDGAADWSMAAWNREHKHAADLNTACILLEQDLTIAQGKLQRSERRLEQSRVIVDAGERIQQMSSNPLNDLADMAASIVRQRAENVVLQRYDRVQSLVQALDRLGQATESELERIIYERK